LFVTKKQHMIDKNLDKDIEFDSNDKTEWYKQHVLSNEQLAKLLEKKYNRAMSYRTDNNLLGQ